MERATFSARLDADVWHRLLEEPGETPTSKLHHALRRLPSPAEPPPAETPAVEAPAAVAAPAETAPDARAVLAERLSTRALLRPLRQVLDDLGPDVSAAEDGSLLLDPGDGGALVRLDDETLDGLLATLRPAAGSGGSGGSPPLPARTPPPKPSLFDTIVRMDEDGNAHVNVSRYSALTAAEQAALQRGGR